MATETERTLADAKLIQARIGQLLERYFKRHTALMNDKRVTPLQVAALACEITALHYIGTYLVDGLERQLLTEVDEEQATASVDWMGMLETLEENDSLQDIQSTPWLKHPPHRPRRMFWRATVVLYHDLHDLIANG